MEPTWEMFCAVGGSVEGGGVSPLAQRGLDKALGFAIGARGIGAGEDVLEPELTTSQGKNIGAEASTVVGHDTLKLYSEALVMGGGLTQESRGGDTLLVGEDGGVGQTGVIVNGDKDKVITGAANGIAAITGHAEAGPMNTGKLFNIDMEQIAGMRPFVTDDGHGWEKISPTVEAGPAQETRDGGAGEAGATGDLVTGELLTTQGDDFLLP